MPVVRVTVIVSEPPADIGAVKRAARTVEFRIRPHGPVGQLLAITFCVNRFPRLSVTVILLK